MVCLFIWPDKLRHASSLKNIATFFGMVPSFWRQGRRLWKLYEHYSGTTIILVIIPRTERADIWRAIAEVLAERCGGGKEACLTFGTFSASLLFLLAQNVEHRRLNWFVQKSQLIPWLNDDRRRYHVDRDCNKPQLAGVETRPILLEIYFHYKCR